MLHKILTSFFLIVAPLVYSPGPANVTLAGLGGNYNFKQTLPFLLGLWFSTISGLLLCVYGMTDFLFKYERVMHYLPIFGGAYLLYMAYMSFRSTKKVKVESNEEGEKGPGFLEGVIFQALNPKFLVFTVSIYSPFLKEGRLFLYVYSIVLFLGGASAHLMWFFMGNRLAHVLGGKKAQYFFSFLLFAVAVWMISTVF